MTTASAAGKVILLGEHAVVYGTPAIAAPVSDVRATVSVETVAGGQGIEFEALDLQQRFRLYQDDASDTARALQTTTVNTLSHLGILPEDQPLQITVRSQIPIARGMGSGTAVATALARALAAYYGQSIAPGPLSALIYQTEIILHGTPSGIDNTVVAYQAPILFTKGQPPEILRFAAPLHLVIADTGIPSRTRDAVQDVRRRWMQDRVPYDALFHEIGELVLLARQAWSEGNMPELGRLMTANHALLQKLTVSSPELDRLVEADLAAGAWGAKLSGGGRGGCMIALAHASNQAAVSAALTLAGASQVLCSEVRPAVARVDDV
jgi:mevalonate kinase